MFLFLLGHSSPHESFKSEAADGVSGAGLVRDRNAAPEKRDQRRPGLTPTCHSGRQCGAGEVLVQFLTLSLRFVFCKTGLIMIY